MWYEYRWLDSHVMKNFGLKTDDATRHLGCHFILKSVYLFILDFFSAVTVLSRRIWTIAPKLLNSTFAAAQGCWTSPRYWILMGQVWLLRWVHYLVGDLQWQGDAPVSFRFFWTLFVIMLFRLNVEMCILRHFLFSFQVCQAEAKAHFSAHEEVVGYLCDWVACLF